MKKYPFWVISFLLFGAFGSVAAQAVAACSSDVLLALARSGSACFSLERDQACYGNGAASVVFQDEAAGENFVQAGDTIALDQVASIAVNSTESDVSVANLLVQASLSDTEAHSVVFLLFGSATIQNHVHYLPEIPVMATGTLNIRSTPDADGDIITQLALNKGVVANGRTTDSQWLRVYIPDSEQLGWASREVVSTQENLDTLAVVDLETPIYNPFQVMTVQTSDAGLCGGTVPGGLLIQTPNVEQPVQMYINSVDVRLAGTAYLDTLTSGYLTVTVLDGEADIASGGESRFVPAGSRTLIPIDTEFGQVNGIASASEPYQLDKLVGLPINNLPGRLTIAEPLTVAQIETLLTERLAEQAAAVVVTSQPIETCKRMTVGTSTLWAGPADFYEAINEIRAGQLVYPVLQITDADGVVWWQLQNSNWIRSGDVTQSGECDDIPLTDFVPRQDYNTISLESCETQNGPLRVGQVVTIQFTPPAFENYYDARIAVRVDPGQITIDERYQHVSPSDPISIGTAGTDQERYVRIFSTTWTATGGAHRIIGERLSYILTCDITVPFG